MSSIKEQLKTLKVIPVIAIDKAEDIIPLGKVLAENGLPAAEITFRSEAAVEAIRLLRETQPDMLIGAGTVLNREQAIAAKEAGATFIVSPGFNPNTVKACQEIGIDIDIDLEYQYGIMNAIYKKPDTKFGFITLMAGFHF